MDEREVEYWGAPDAERVYHADKDDAIESILSGFDVFPETIEVCGYAHMVPNWAAYAPLDDILEHLDEEYSDPDGDVTEPTPAMREAEQAFMKVLAEEYTSFACEAVVRETVDVAQWIEEHHPEWLEETNA